MMGGSQSASSSPSPEEDTGTNRTALTLLDLPNEVFLRLVAFADFSEHMALTLTCKKARDCVEAHEKRVYEAIKREHRVDETFDERVGDQSNLETTITKREKPVDLPYRYRKTVGMKKPLYTIMLNEQLRNSTRFILSPSEDHILVPMWDAPPSAFLFSLSTRERVTTFEHNRHVPMLGVFFLDNDRVITETRGELLLWSESENGEWKSEQFFEKEAGRSMGFMVRRIRNEQILLSFQVDAGETRLSFVSIDTSGRTVQRNVLVEGWDDIYSAETIGFSGNKWLLFNISADGSTVWLAFNFETNQTISLLIETGRSLDDLIALKQSLDCSRTFFGLRLDTDGRRNIVLFDFNEDNGHLSGRFSFRIDRNPKILAVLKSHVFVQSGLLTRIYNARTGECCRYLGHFGGATWLGSVVLKSRQEVYIADVGRDALKAYCLEAPHIIM